MAVLRWEPVGELHSIQNEMNRLFNSVFDPPAQAAGENPSTRRWMPAMDLVETSGYYVLRADLPGISDADLNIDLEDNVLTISGERKAVREQDETGYYRVERAFGTFSRSLTLPDGVDPDSVQADFDRGVLEIRIPKPEQRKPRKVAIRVADGASDSTIEAGETQAGNGASAGDPAAASP